MLFENLLEKPQFAAITKNMIRLYKYVHLVSVHSKNQAHTFWVRNRLCIRAYHTSMVFFCTNRSATTPAAELSPSPLRSESFFVSKLFGGVGLSGSHMCAIFVRTSHFWANIIIMATSNSAFPRRAAAS